MHDFFFPSVFSLHIYFKNGSADMRRMEQKMLRSPQALKGDKEINLRHSKVGKGTNTVVMTREEKLNEGQIQLNVREHYRSLESPMIEETGKRALNLIMELYQGNFIDEMTKKWLCQTLTPPRILIFYTLTKIQKPTPVGIKTNNIEVRRTNRKAILLC